MDGDILWTPAPDAGETTKMGRFMAEVARRHSEPLVTYDDFQAWSIKHLEDFYAEMAEFCGVRFTDPPREVLTTRAVPDATWFPGATLNFAEHVFRALPAATVITGVSEVRAPGSRSGPSRAGAACQVKTRASRLRPDSGRPAT